MKIKTAKYITVLDFEVARVFRYTISKWTGGPVIDWNPDYESCEDFLTNKGHNLGNCEWMVHEKGHIWARHNVEQIEASRFYNYNVNTNEDG